MDPYPPFCTSFLETMTITAFTEGQWQPHQTQPLQPLSLHPAAHVLQYAGTCFEGIKVFHGVDGIDRIFRMDQHIARFRNSARLLCLPVPPAELVETMIRALVARLRDHIPPHSGALYVRPTLIGETVSGWGKPIDRARLFVLATQVGDYFQSGLKPVSIYIDDQHTRTSPDFGIAKAGANYACSLHHVMQARAAHQVDQVLFAPDGDVQETGATNFLILNDQEVVTKRLTPAFLHGITRDALLKLAADLGYRVSERDISVEEVLEWAKTGEAALSGTAATLIGIGSFIYQDRTYPVGDGSLKNTQALRRALIDIQTAAAPDNYAWLTQI